MSLRVHCVRHAPTEAAGRAIGRTDVSTILSAKEACARIDLVLPNVSAVWSSPLRRCFEPAACLASRRGVPHCIDPALYELDHGVFEGRSYVDLEREEPEALQAWMNDWLERGPPSGEAARDVQARVAAWLHARRSEAHHDIAIVAHAGVVRALQVIVEGQSWEQAMSAPVPHLQRIAFVFPPT